jgi:hypothetical protein
MKLVVDVGEVQVYPYLLGDAVYPLQTYLMKNSRIGVIFTKCGLTIE